MALYSRLKNWVTNEVLTANDLNAEFDNVLNNAQAQKVAGFSSTVGEMQTTASPGGVGTENLSTTVADELARIRFVLARIIAPGAQWYQAPARTLNSLTLTLADFTDGLITRPKLAAVGHQISASSGAFSVNSISYVDVTNLVVTLTSTGRPVKLGLMADSDPSTPSQIYARAVSSTPLLTAYVRILRYTMIDDDANNATPLVESAETEIYQTVITGSFPDNDGQLESFAHTHTGVSPNDPDAAGVLTPVSLSAQTMTMQVAIPSTSIQHLDAPAAGTYKYKVQVSCSGGTDLIRVWASKLYAYEL